MKFENNYNNHCEDKLLLYCARVNLNTEIKEKITAVIHEDFDWQYLLQIASTNKLKPLLYYNLNSVCPEKVPKNILEELKEYYNFNIAKNLLMTGELIKILNTLKSNNIDAIPYKGPVLANLAYGNLSLRDFGDIDILIKRSDAVFAKNIIISNGYELYPPITINDKFYMKLEPEYRFLNKSTHTPVEIKWKIEGNFFSFPHSKTLSYNLEEINLNGYKVDTFSFTTHLLILCIHASKHDWSRLSWICDISELLKSQKNINWQEIIEKSDEMRINRILFISLLLASDLFDLELPNEILYKMKSDSHVLKISNQIKERIFSNNNSLNIFRKFILDLKKRDNLRYGFQDCINDLTRPTYADFENISLPEILFILYFIIRPFLLLKRYGTNSI